MGTSESMHQSTCVYMRDPGLWREDHSQFLAYYVWCLLCGSISQLMKRGCAIPQPSIIIEWP